MLLSCALAILMLIALRNVRNTLLLAGRSPEKLERLFYRILIISIARWLDVRAQTSDTDYKILRSCYGEI
ncbi:hypothetical protein NQ317_002480 [Molorchus minor]|uniref:Uncharacterized protein n=1 Tax=Molorchus minor TaxID=1323400 RepID=A0ABQ9IV78_9CUCU|nr:hypothetical protein NQ317_002480 [Molorchus minor]